MAKFKVGDRVKIVRNDYLKCEIGDTGTIMAYNSGAGYAVEFDIPRPSYHSCRGLTTPGYGQWASEENIELIEPIKDKPTREFKLIITFSGDTTTAKLIHGKTTTKEATVTRYSKDEYSEKAAVEAVVDKIFEKKVDWFNGKVVCVAYSGDGFTKGKIYECIEGELTSDSGDKMGAYTIEKMKNSQLFLPIVEGWRTNERPDYRRTYRRTKMKIKSGTKVRVIHKRKGTFTGYAAEDFDTETTEFYPIKAAHFVDGISNDWDEGEIVPCRNTLCKIEVQEDK